jgi:hypothetical protein
MFTYVKARSASQIEVYHFKDNQGYYKFESAFFGGKLAANWGLAGKEVTQNTWHNLINGNDPDGK